MVLKKPLNVHLPPQRKGSKNFIGRNYAWTPVRSDFAALTPHQPLLTFPKSESFTSWSSATKPRTGLLISCVVLLVISAATCSHLHGGGSEVSHKRAEARHVGRSLSPGLETAKWPAEISASAVVTSLRSPQSSSLLLEKFVCLMIIARTEAHLCLPILLRQWWEVSEMCSL